LSALTVATRTTQSGLRPEARHLMLKNFSIPMSAPKPACGQDQCSQASACTQEHSNLHAGICH
jgi:hypothetical protein